MTTIRMTVDVAYPAGLLHGEQVYDMPAGEAEAMVIMGWAEEMPEEYAGTTTTVPTGYTIASTLIYGRHGETL